VTAARRCPPCGGPTRLGGGGRRLVSFTTTRLLTAILIAAAAVAALAVPALASTEAPGPAELPGVPAAALLAHGRVLVLRPHRLQLAVDGRVDREIPVEQPLDLGRLPDIVGDPAVAARTAPGVVRLAAVLLQRPGTVVEGGPLSLELADSGGAGPARLSGTRATLRLHDVTVTTLPQPAGTPAAVAAGLRYLHGSDLALQDVSLIGLGTTGAAGVAALRADGDSRVRLLRVALRGGGRGIRVDDPAQLDVDALQVQARGVALTVVGARHAELSGLHVDASTDALVVEGSRDVVVRQSELRAARDALRVVDSRPVVLQSVATTGAVRGPVTRGDPRRAFGGAASSPSLQPTPRSSWSPVHGAGAVALLVLAGGVLLEIGRSWRRRSFPSR
jgi:hypothetical protein